MTQDQADPPTPPETGADGTDRLALADVVEVSAALAATRSRLAKTSLLAELLRRTVPEEIRVVASWLSGVLPQGRVGVGYRSLGELPPPVESATLTVAAVDQVVTALAGEGRRAERARLLTDLFGAATAAEQDYLKALLLGEVRQGALDGILLPAIASAAQAPEEVVRRAAMLAGDSAVAAELALTGGEAALAEVRLTPGRPVRPMLAGSAAEVEDVLAAVAEGTELVLETKLDGIRIQVHRAGEEITVYTRSLDDITARVPEVVELAAGFPGGDLVLDGEAIALRPDGSPRPFQETGARTASRRAVAELRAATPLTTYVFDVLHLGGRDLIDEPWSVRHEALLGLVPEAARVPSVVTADPATARAFFAEVVAAGHEGVVVKTLDAPYAAGRRGSAWTKVKPRHTLDLVVLAVEWGSGRRRGLLSNIHLGARDETSGELVMVGKTFKGMTDEVLAWQTERFLGLETHREGHVVHLRPEQVVEIALDGVQTSRRYPGGVALRFARVVRYRDDKTAAEADTLDAVRSLPGG